MPCKQEDREGEKRKEGGRGGGGKDRERCEILHTPNLSLDKIQRKEREEDRRRGGGRKMEEGRRKHVTWRNRK